ncbi:MAG: SUMF1/EgtB/PvdO family nonheme iron enzyme, partial [Elusimicrobia bacterium]|nr:SUMF1/EgtB/PvdO family nonheme iron enzyme [Elusimicrobiota bacterium]
AAVGGTNYGSVYPAGCNVSGQGCAAGGAGPIYAQSVVGVLPAVSITWYQAQIACGNAGKELLPNAIWQMAASGTPDPGVAGQTSPNCNTGGSAAVASGLDTNCVSNYGVMDMDGNVWQWVAEWGSYTPTTNGVWPAGPGSGEYLYGNGSATIGAVIRGGDWGNGAGAGVFAFSASGGPSSVNNLVGFRCGRRR